MTDRPDIAKLKSLCAEATNAWDDLDLAEPEPITRRDVPFAEYNEDPGAAFSSADQVTIRGKDGEPFVSAARRCEPFPEDVERRALLRGLRDVIAYVETLEPKAAAFDAYESAHEESRAWPACEALAHIKRAVDDARKAGA